MVKIFGYVLLVVATLLLPAQARSDGFDVSTDIGAAIVVGPSSTLRSIGGHFPLNLSIGYSFGSFRIAVEGMAAFPFFQYGVSIIGNGTFASNDILRSYALLGVGYGTIIFSEKIGLNDGDFSGNGWLQLQAGIGIGFPITSWLELGTETRCQIGVPKFPEIVALTQDIWVMFRF